MRMNSIRLLGHGVLMAVLLSSTLGCVPMNSTLPVDIRTVELGQADNAQAYIRMESGQLKVAEGYDEFLKAAFIYHMPTKRPELTYEVIDQTGQLFLQQVANASVGAFPTGDGVNTWDLQFNHNVPLTLRVEFGSGKSVLKVGELLLKKFDLFLGDGDVLLDLQGVWRDDVLIKIRGGSGKLAVLMPRNIGVQISTKDEIDSLNMLNFIQEEEFYVNNLYSQSDEIMYIDLQVGEGSVIFK